MRPLMLKSATLPTALLLAACSGGIFGSKGGSSAPAPTPKPCTTTALTDRARAAAAGLAVYDGTTIGADVAPFVGSLVASQDSSEALCSGSLICPNVVLTAAHCFNDGTHPALDPKNYRFSMSPTVPFTGSADDQSHAPADSTAGVAVQIVPGWTGVGTSSSADMAILQLAHPMNAPLAKLTFDEITFQANATTGVDATAIGYGEATQQGGGAGTKRTGAVVFDGAVPGDAGTLVTTRGAQGQDTCEGDSGGPLLINGNVYGTLSGGDAEQCGAPITGKVQGLSYYSSVPNNKAWIQGIMQQWCGTTTPSASTSTATTTTTETPCQG